MEKRLSFSFIRNKHHIDATGHLSGDTISFDITGNMWGMSKTVHRTATQPARVAFLITDRPSDSQIVAKFELFDKWRTFPNLVRSPLDDRLASGDLTSDSNVLASSWSLSHINPLGSTID